MAQTVGTALIYGIYLNLILAFFNLLPIPPLDGSHVVAHLLPASWAVPYRKFGRYGVLVLIAIVFFVPEVLGVLLTPVDLAMGVVDQWIRLWR
jgi:Zn-dependent protease